MTPSARRAAALALLLATAPAGAAGDLILAADHPLLKNGLTHLYSLDYDKTLQNAVAFRETHPANPLGHLFLSGALWWQYTTESEQLRPDSNFLERFDAAVDATVEASKPLMKSEDDEASADGYFAAGMVLGLRGQMKLANGEFFGAYRDGKKGIKFLKKCLKADPAYYDALLGLGIFDYQVAVLPGVLKFGAKLLFRGTGDAARGLRNIRDAIVRGRFANNQAAGFLLTIYMTTERDYQRAFGVASDLHKAFPRSPYYGFLHAALLHRNGKPLEARAAMRALFDRLNEEPESFARKQLGTVCGQFGPACLDRNYLSAAHAWLQETLTAERDASQYKTLLTLYRGLVLELLDDREGALQDYAAVAELPDILAAREWALRCSRKPCGKEDAIRFLRGARP